MAVVNIYISVLLALVKPCVCVDISEPGYYAPIIATVIGVALLIILIVIILCRSYKKIKAKNAADYENRGSNRDHEKLMPTIAEAEEDAILNSRAGGAVDSWRKDLKSKLRTSPSPTSDEDDEPYNYAPKKSSTGGSLDDGDGPKSMRSPLVSGPKSAGPGNLTGKTPRSIKEKDKKNKKKKDSTPIELDDMGGGDKSPYSTLERGKKGEGPRASQRSAPVPRPRSMVGVDARARNAEDNRSRKSVTFEDDKISRKSVTFLDDDDEEEEPYTGRRGYGQTDQEKLMSTGRYHADMYGEQEGAPRQPPPTRPKPPGGFSYGMPPPPPSRPYRGSNPAISQRDDRVPRRDDSHDEDGSDFGSARKKYGSQGDGLDGRRNYYDERKEPSGGGKGQGGSSSRGPDSASVYSSRT